MEGIMFVVNVVDKKITVNYDDNIIGEAPRSPTMLYTLHIETLDGTVEPTFTEPFNNKRRATLRPKAQIPTRQGSSSKKPTRCRSRFFPSRQPPDNLPQKS